MSPVAVSTRERRSSIAAKRRVFREMHSSGCFVIPNPWDIGSAKFLQSLGFKALATTSSGFAWSRGCADGGVRLEQVLEHLRSLVDATSVPVNADFEHGFAQDLAELAANVERAVDTGVAGLSIEDSTQEASQPLFTLDAAAERVRVARAAIDRIDPAALLVGRAEGFLLGRTAIDEIIERLRAYAQAGADCLYAPGVAKSEDIAAIVHAVSPKPVNVLIHSPSDVRLQDMARLGVRRVSVGGALAASAWSGFIQAAQALLQGRFDALRRPAIDLNQAFKRSA